MYRSMNIKSLAVAVSALVLSTSVNAAITQVDTSIGAGADTFINNQSKGTNYGDSTDMLLRNDGDNSWGWHRQSYLRFDLSTVTQPITSATFDVGLIFNTLVYNEASIANIWDVEIYGLLDNASGNNWGENTITWNNAPGNNLGSNGFTSEFQLLGTVSAQGMVAGDRLTFDGLSLMDFISNDTDNLITLGIRRANHTRTDSSFILSTKENTDYTAPTLTLTTPSIATVPVPAAVWLFGSGLLGLVGVARRKSHS